VSFSTEPAAEPEIPLGALPRRRCRRFAASVGAAGFGGAGARELNQRIQRGLAVPKSDVRAIDHIGITVPNLDDAQRFFENVLGAEFLYDMLPGPVSGPVFEQAIGVPKGTVLNAIRMMRLGNGPSLELFSFVSDDQREPVRPSDLGVQHFAIFVDDIEAVAKRVEDHGGKVLGQIDRLPGLDAGPNNRFVYTQTPWGGRMELVDIPSPQAYRAVTKLRRWQPEPS
jgi:catechol 2,3-dioxygenase-like lactoylglutathione lyase family enzyme